MASRLDVPKQWAAHPLGSTEPAGSGVPSRFPRAVAAARTTLPIWLPIDPETMRVSELRLVPGNSTPAAR
jgi:hypothetical protein